MVCDIPKFTIISKCELIVYLVGKVFFYWKLPSSQWNSDLLELFLDIFLIPWILKAQNTTRDTVWSASCPYHSFPLGFVKKVLILTVK